MELQNLEEFPGYTSGINLQQKLNRYSYASYNTIGFKKNNTCKIAKREVGYSFGQY
jgi:hypothetical protein